MYLNNHLLPSSFSFPAFSLTDTTNPRGENKVNKKQIKEDIEGQFCQHCLSASSNSDLNLRFDP